MGGRITESGRLGAFITKVKKGSLADVVGNLRAGRQRNLTSDIFGRFSQECEFKSGLKPRLIDKINILRKAQTQNFIFFQEMKFYSGTGNCYPERP